MTLDTTKKVEVVVKLPINSKTDREKRYLKKVKKAYKASLTK